MTWVVYMLRCRDGSLYTGITNQLERRMKAHQAGKGSRYTRSRLPVELAYTEPAAGRAAALRREAALKKQSRAEKLRRLEGCLTPPHADGAARSGAAQRRGRMRRCATRSR